MRILLFILGFSSFGLHAQKVNLDSLWGVWDDPDQNDTNKLEAIQTLAWNGYLFNKPDSAFLVAQLQYDYAKETGFTKEMGIALNTQGVSFAIRGEYSMAIDSYLKSIEIYEEIGFKKGISSSFNNLGVIYKNKGSFEMAIDYYSKSLKIDQETKNERQIPSTLNNIGTIYSIQGDYSLANDYYLKSLKLREKIGDKKGIASSLNNIGNVYKNQASYEKALEIYFQSLKITEEIGDKRGIATLFQGIGIVHKNQGNYALAIDYYFKSLEIRKEIGDKKGVASSMINIGNVYAIQGIYPPAIDYLSKSLEINVEVGYNLGVASSLMNLGVTYYLQKDYANATENFSKSLSHHQKMGDKIGTAMTLNNIGNVYREQGNFSKANEHYLTSLDINKELGDKQAIAVCYNNLGTNFYYQEEYNKVISHCLHSISTAQDVGDTKTIKDACMVLLPTYIILDSIREASKLANLLRDMRLEDLQHNYSIFSEQQKEMYFATMVSDFNLLYDFAIRYPSLNKQAENSFDNSLLTKGLLLKSSIGMRTIILSSGDSLLTEKYFDWIAYKRRIAKAYAEGGDIFKMEERAEELEKELVKGSQEFSDIKKVHELNWKDVQSSLKEDEAAIEFVRFTHQEDYRNDSSKIQLYAALIIDSDCEHPSMVRLFEEPELEKILGTFPGNNLSYIEQVYGSKENTKSQLYDLIWKPMENTLTDAKKVYVSPVGMLHKISFAALAKEKDIYLCDLYDVELKSSTGKIVTEDPNSFMLDDNASTTIFGGIEYTRNEEEKEVWSYLEGTKIETQKIHKTVENKLGDVTYYSGFNATEEVFKEEAPNSNILHIATHGFFYMDPNEIEDKIETDHIDDEELVFRGGNSGMGYEAFVQNHNPLMRSGIVFAGSNDVWSKTEQEGDDGVLTAAEVITLDLRKTDLVVLSACETGLGDIKGSEGVYGLQRSFKMAGAKYLIMSLWQVPDKETSEFMTTFYKYLTKTKDIKASFNQTQKVMRKKYDPYYWAAFVLIE
jgi:CHAT domain-containing protein/Tfp pilus assembly protein PilF